MPETSKPKAPDHLSSAFGDITSLTPGNIYDFAIKEHISQRAGKHYDIRLGDSSGLFSWATKKPFPESPGEIIKLFQQPIHKYEYLDFEGVIPPGYGHGPVKTKTKGKVLLTSVKPNEIDFTLETGKGLVRYKMLKTQPGKDWLLITSTPQLEVPQKIKFRLVDEENVKNLLDKLGQGVAAVQPKIDGAFTFIFVRPDGSLELISPRISKRTGGPIFYTEKLFAGRPKTNIPREYRNSLLVGEIYGVMRDAKGREKIIPVNELSGILNSSLSNALDYIRKNKIDFRVMVFDVYRTGKDTPVNPYSIPYNERKRLLEYYLNYLPEKFHAPIEVTDRQSAEKLIQAIKAQQFGLTNEGVIIYPEVGVPYKFKTYKDEDFYIVGFTPGEGKYKDLGIGGILISDKPNGKPIAVVGTGLTDLMRREMYKNPEEYLGRKITVKYQEKTPRGSLRAPVFLQFAD